MQFFKQFRCQWKILHLFFFSVVCINSFSLKSEKPTCWPHTRNYCVSIACTKPKKHRISRRKTKNNKHAFMKLILKYKFEFLFLLLLLLLSSSSSSICLQKYIYNFFSQYNYHYSACVEINLSVWLIFFFRFHTNRKLENVISTRFFTSAIYFSFSKQKQSIWIHRIKRLPVMVISQKAHCNEEKTHNYRVI